MRWTGKGSFLVAGLVASSIWPGVVMAACWTDVMRPFQFATVGTFCMSFCLECMVRAAHVALRRRGFSFWNRHGEILLRSGRRRSSPAKERPR